MKKMILIPGVMSLICLTYCKKETEGSASKIEKTTTGTTINGVAVPKFRTPQMEEYAIEYAKYANETMHAASSGDYSKMSGFEKEAEKLIVLEDNLKPTLTLEDEQALSNFKKAVDSAQRK